VRSYATLREQVHSSTLTAKNDIVGLVSLVNLKCRAVQLYLFSRPCDLKKDDVEGFGELIDSIEEMLFHPRGGLM